MPLSHGVERKVKMSKLFKSKGKIAQVRILLVDDEPDLIDKITNAIENKISR